MRYCIRRDKYKADDTDENEDNQKIIKDRMEEDEICEFDWRRGGCFTSDLFSDGLELLAFIEGLMVVDDVIHSLLWLDQLVGGVLGFFVVGGVLLDGIRGEWCGFIEMMLWYEQGFGDDDVLG